ncbi:MAG: AbrB/MazE/SpoVT family DNA-binding domain-containing protein [Eubacteriales bacterium]
MMNFSRLTPQGQITIPRSILKGLGITKESKLQIEFINNSLVLKKVDERVDEEEESHR